MQLTRQAGYENEEALGSSRELKERVVGGLPGFLRLNPKDWVGLWGECLEH